MKFCPHAWDFFCKKKSCMKAKCWRYKNVASGATDRQSCLWRIARDKQEENWFFVSSHCVFDFLSSEQACLFTAIAKDKSEIRLRWRVDSFLKKKIMSVSKMLTLQVWSQWYDRSPSCLRLFARASNMKRLDFFCKKDYAFQQDINGMIRFTLRLTRLLLAYENRHVNKYLM